jgi:hypothetical protein
MFDGYDVARKLLWIDCLECGDVVTVKLLRDEEMTMPLAHYYGTCLVLPFMLLPFTYV